MPRPNPHRPFVPDPAQMARAPAISGNAVNGLGEAEPRRPSRVYWATDPDTIAHGGMQRWFYTVDPDAPEITVPRAERQAILDAPLPPVAPAPDALDPKTRRAALDALVAEGWCEKLGTCAWDPDWLFEGEDDPGLPRVVVMGVRHDYEEIAHAPAIRAGGEVMRQYTRAAASAKEAAARLRRAGWRAEPVTGPMATLFTLIPPALAAGFGELGKHGSVIDPELGASFRLSAVLTDAPLALDAPVDHGIDGFCAACRICEDACPPVAIHPEKRTVRGVEKWYVDFDACLPFFNEHHGCAICIAVCPWSRPGVGPSLAAKLARRRDRG